MHFTDEQNQRYRRHLILREIGAEGQERLLQARVLIIGVGGLGSSLGYYLSAAGVGTIALADDDVVDLSNLQRQIAHNTRSLGTPKVESARDTFQALNPDVSVIAIRERVTKENVHPLIRDYDIVADCSDNYATRFLVNDACVIEGKPLVTGAISEFEGQLTAVIPGESPCYRCLFEEPPPPDTLPDPADSGILGVIPGVIGTLQASEILKLITGAGHILKGELLIYDALTPSFRKVKIPKNPECRACGGGGTMTGLVDEKQPPV
jgi:adenylyltransferase/sulfurtransferase